MIRTKLEEARRALLDLTRRNRLLNFRPGAANVAPIVGENPSSVYRLLAEEQRTLQFLSVEEAPGPVRGPTPEPQGETEGEGPLFDLAAIESAAQEAGAHDDRFLQTSLTARRLQTVLLNLSRQAESSLQEQGCNVLYLSIGILEWADKQGVRSLAPLLLVPVELSRKSVRHRFSLRMIDEEAVVNPVLRELCRSVFGVTLPDLPLAVEARPDDPGAAAGGAGPVIGLFEAMGRLAVPGASWTLRPDMYVSALSFAKHLMYLDLEPSRWKGDRSIDSHPLIVSLLGLGSLWPRPGAPMSPTDLDDKVPPSETFQVLDADSSQQCAIRTAKLGASMVIEGPPGTGKSQTITNIIAECLSAGKTVLFVAEKAAALDVVKRRLEGVGLGDFVAELHSRKASKRAFMEELARVLAKDAEAPAPAGQAPSAEELARLRARLNHHARTLHRPVGAMGQSVYDAIGRCAVLADAPEAGVRLGQDPAHRLIDWKPDQLRAAEESAAALGEAVGRVGDVSRHPWRGVRATEVALGVRQQLPSRLASLEKAVEAFARAGERLAGLLGCRAPANTAEATELIRASEHRMRCTIFDGSGVAAADWEASAPKVARLLEAGARLDSLREDVSDRWSPEAENQEWAQCAGAYRDLGGSVVRFLSGRWWGARRQVRSCWSGPPKPDAARLIEDMGKLTEIRRLRAQVLQDEGAPARLLGSLWRRDRSEWGQIERCVEAVARLRALVSLGLGSAQSISAAAARATPELLKAATDGARITLQRVTREWDEIKAPLVINESDHLGSPWQDVPFTVLRTRLGEMASSVDVLGDWTEFQRSLGEARTHAGDEFVAWALSQVAPRDQWARALARQFHRLWLEQAMSSTPGLASFRGEDHNRIVEAFRHLDRAWLTHTRARLATGVASARPRVGEASAATSGLGILEGEIRKKRNLRSIRQLLGGPAGEAVIRIKPCFMMSPISVAQFLEPGRLGFDVVIFDEASQVEPADALGAIARGRQIILVGDEKQLPPTNFFAGLSGEPARSEDDLAGAMHAGDLESVLGLGVSTIPLRASLRWHYRSRDPSLISFSNAEFYDGHLRVFPSPTTGAAGSSAAGLSLVHVAEGVYRRAKGQTNPQEARRVALAVMDHARTRPQESLGVGAFSAAQQREIEDQIEALRVELDDPAVEKFLAPGRAEPFFVKNLETVQGDERDAMILSVGYGPDEDGRITMNFGPLNHDGGWRRLNVLVTRARVRCVVYTSILAESIRVDRATPRGVAALRAYLAYAADASHGSLATAEDPGELVRAVAARLEESGRRILLGVGMPGFSVDIGVLDPDDPSRVLLGVECDGPTYRACATARDRDRLRASVLEGLGWTLHRVWAADWHRNADRAFHALEQSIAKARSKRGAMGTEAARVEPAPSPRSAAPVEPSQGEVATAAPAGDARTGSAAQPPDYPPGVTGYERFRGPGLGDREALLKAPLSKLAALVQSLVAAEGPIHREEAVRVLCDLHVCRATGQAAQRVGDAVASAVDSGAARLWGEFLVPPGMDRAPLRSRDTYDAVTDAELICSEEAMEAACWVVRSEFGVPMDDLPGAVVRRMGFRRVTKALEDMARRGIDLGLRSGRLAADTEGFVRAADR